MSVPAKNVACVLIGEESLLIECGNQLRDRGYTISAVVSKNTQLADWAASANVKTIDPASDLEQQLNNIEYDWFFSIANLRMLPRAVWSKARIGAVNFHDGPLPEYAGLNTPAWAIAAGETTYGVTWHALADGADTGDIYVQRHFEIAGDETTFSLNTKCFEAGIESFSDLLDRIGNGDLQGRPQSFENRKYFARNDRPALGATLDFRKSSEELERLARALNFGPSYANPLCLTKVRTGNGAYNVFGVEIADGHTGRPGTVLAVDHEGLLVATANGALHLSGLTDISGKNIRPQSVANVHDVLPELSGGEAEDLAGFLETLIPHESYFQKKIGSFRDLDLHGFQPANDDASPQMHAVDLAGHRSEAGALADASAILAGLSRLSDQSRFDVALVNDALTDGSAQFAGYIGPLLPLSVSVEDGVTADRFEAKMVKSVEELAARGGFTGDLISRTPSLDLPDASIALRITDKPESAGAYEGAVLTFVIPERHGAIRMFFDATRLGQADAFTLAERIQIAVNAYTDNSAIRIADLPLMTHEAKDELLVKRNLTERAYDRDALAHQLFETQARKTPDAIALVCGGRSLSYAQLDAHANAVANRLTSEGAGPDTLVGIYMNRSIDLVVAALGIWKAGAAYVPLDPTYPRDRIALMIEDSGLGVIVAQSDIAASIPAEGPRTIAIEDVPADAGNASSPESATRSENLAYVIYTSGSTGRPKGVMVEHRNVVNFFAGMDDRIRVPADEQPVWLAVTSLSFDISVLELFWTLTRGFKVVIHVDNRHEAGAPPIRRSARSQGGMDFSLFYWGHDDTASANKYKLLLDSARFADEHGFQAVWTPERHFHAFGGPYPNPAVTGAAVASITKNLEIRAGSCVLPLHHPARVAEEWAVIDNITNGRTGLAFAAGWMPEDFLLRPENAPPNNKTAMLRDIDTVRKLWRGEKVQFEAPGGKMVDVLTQPRPVQKELPVWVTTAGNPETYRDAARNGANVLTHLLGQSIEEVGEKIKIYRQALQDSGRNPADHKVTLMLHTLVGHDREQVRETARQPMKEYLRSAAALIKQYAWAFPAFKKPQGTSNPMDIDLQSLDEEELDAILEFAFLRYFDDSGFFGTVDDAVARADELKAIGVDEIACLIDFGVSHDVALKALEPLAEVIARINPQTEVSVVQDEADRGVAALIERHGVTHIQCTPSMATMLLLNDEDRHAMRSVRHLFIGGEALQSILIRDLRSVTDATIENMYGPTETTIWSSTAAVGDVASNAPLGTAIANTQLYILDSVLRPVPPGVPGELFIGGDGVTRGYLNREELTRERFLPNPFIEGGRIYRTGDLVRIGSDGEIQFIGRTDHQVKVRGYRIELGEIEARLGLHPGVSDAVVIAREDKANDVRIVAYLRYKSAAVPEKELTDHVCAALPDFMAPVHFVKMDAFPLTPNAKVDRNALPPPNEVKQETQPIEFLVPANEVQQRIADTYKRVLGVERVGALDNFFQLGGHSLLAVQVHRELKKNVAPQLGITDIYRFPTVSGLAEHISGDSKADQQLSKIAKRATMRRNAMGGRRSLGVRGREAF
ncbi:MAG: LLM class flavin-dependent oxidoreductase [Hyphomicrobiales bacterium]|nr:LLM class flavin-dependent oxidoreductase [Hyphomicrobiales bacterium]